MTAMTDALADLREALLEGEDKDTAIAEIAAEHGVKPALLARFAETMPMSRIPVANDKTKPTIKVVEQKAVRVYRDDEFDRALRSLVKLLMVA